MRGRPRKNQATINIFSYNFNRLCAEKHFTPSAVATALNLSTSAITPWRQATGMPSAKTIIALCDLFKVDREEFFKEINS